MCFALTNSLFPTLDDAPRAHPPTDIRIEGRLHTPHMASLAEVRISLAPLIDIRGLHKSFGDHHVLKGIDITVDAGEVVCVIGPSGSGKSTLLNCINFLEPYGPGEVWVDGTLIGYKKDDKGELASCTRSHLEPSAREDRHRFPAIQFVSAPHGA